MWHHIRSKKTDSRKWNFINLYWRSVSKNLEKRTIMPIYLLGEKRDKKTSFASLIRIIETRWGECSGGFFKVNTDRYGCSTARNKGDSVCVDKKAIKASVLEDAVLKALEMHLNRKAITGLKKSLKSGKAAGAKEHVRALIEKTVLTPKGNHQFLW